MGFLGDLSAVVSGAGLAVRTAGTVSKVSALSRAGQAITKVGLAAEPTTVLIKTAGIVTKPFRVVGGALVTGGLGVTTGAGRTVIQQAFRNPNAEFKAALRGQTTADNIIANAREGLYRLKDERGKTYRSQLEKVKNATESLDVTEIRAFVDEKLKEFNIKRTDKGLDFSKSVIADKTEANRISDFLTETMKWTDNTPAGLDILKQRLDDFYTPSGKGRALTNALRNKLDTFLDKNVEGYAKMTSSYRETTQLIDEIEHTLSLGSKSTADALLKKLASAMKDNNEIRLALVKELDKLVEADLSAQLTGYALRPGIPSGLIGRSAFAGALGVGTGVFPGPNLAGIVGLAITSPRAVGEFLRVTGLSAQKVQKLAGLLNSQPARAALLSAYQAGRAFQFQPKLEQ